MSNLRPVDFVKPDANAYEWLTVWWMGGKPLDEINKGLGDMFKLYITEDQWIAFKQLMTTTQAEVIESNMQRRSDG